MQDGEVSSESAEPFILTAISPVIRQGSEPTITSPLPLNTLPEVCSQHQDSKYLIPAFIIQVSLVCVKQVSELDLVTSHYLRRYREEHGDSFQLQLSDNNLTCLVKLHRALTFPM